MTVALSRHTGPLTTAPSSTIGTYVNRRERKLTFASEWYFKPDGVRDVKERFEAELSKREIAAQHEWSNTDYIFRVRCLAGEVETVWLLFQNILRTIIKEEGGEIDRSCDYDSESTSGGNNEKTFNSKKIENLAVWEKQHLPSESANDEPPKPDPATSFPDTVKFYKFRKTWSFPTQGIDKFEVAISDGIITELSKLTDCQLAKNATEGLVYIGSHNEEAYLNVVSRLNNILKLFSVAEFRQLRLNQPYMNHMFYTEEVDNAKFTLNTLVNVKKAYFETTLLDNLQMSEFHDYDNLHQAVTVRLAPFDHLKNFYIPIKNLKFGPAISAAERDLGTVLKQWVDFKYCPKGEPADNPLRHFPAEIGTPSNPSPSGSLPTPPPHSTFNAAAPSSDTPAAPIRDTPSSAKIEQWASEIPFLVTLPSNQPSGPALKAPAKKANWDTVIEVGEHNPHEKAKKLNPNPTNNTSSALAKNLDAINAEKATLSVISKTATMPASMVPLEPVKLDQKRQTSCDKHTTTADLDVSLGSSTSPSKPTRPVNLDFVDNADHLVGFFNHKVEHSLLDDGISIAGLVSDEFKVLEPAKKSGSGTSNTTARQSNVVSQKFQNQPEKIQYIDEVATRTFHNTMNQMAPKSKKSSSYAGRLELPSPPRIKKHSEVEVPDPLPEFVQVLVASFGAMIQGIQGFRGKIVVQAEFGRVLLRNIKPSHLTTKERDYPLDAMFLHNLLTSGNEVAPLTFFTKPLNILPAEIQYLVEMKDKAFGNDLWEHRLFDWDVKYEFFCQDQKAVDYTPFTIEIDGEKFGCEIKTRRDLGNIYINGAKRHWDVRISATGYEIKEYQEKYADLASSIEASLYIPPDLQKPAVYFELENSLLEKYDLDGIRVHRISRYKSTDQNSVLEIHENRDLDVAAMNVPGKPRKVFRAISNVQDRVACEKLDYWHEVNISSVRAEEVLEANTKLELGEEAAWDLSKIKAAEDIYHPALEMLKQMDGIGCWNDNGIDVRSYKLPVPQQPHQNYVFW